METVIHKLETHYRLPLGSESEQRRLDRLRMSVLEKAFERAAARAGIGEDAELCIRGFSASVHLRLNASDEAITTMWSDALVEEIVRATRYGHSTRVVVYYSRRQALLDIALSVIRGDLQRAWAWRQLKLWRADHVAGAHEAMGQLVHALGSAPAMVVPALNTLARMGYLPALANRLASEHWENLAGAVLTEARMEHLLDTAADADAEGASSRTMNDARRVLNRSRLLRAIGAGGPHAQSRPTARAIAALAIMETDPSRLRKKSARRLIDIVASVIVSTGAPLNSADLASTTNATDAAGLTPLEPTKRRRTQENLLEWAAEKPSTAAESSGRAEQISGKTSSDDMSDLKATAIDNRRPRTELPSKRNAEAAGRKTAPTGNGSTKSGTTEFDEVDTHPEGEPELPDFRTRAFSRYAGLLFLISIIDELDLPELMLTDGLLGARPFVWVLHQLALVLAPVEPRDPGALAFAGLPPEAVPPSEDEDPPSTDETATLNDLAERIVVSLLARLDGEKQTKDSVLEYVTRRRGEIVADPGWIEAKFSLDDVETEIRRARLDLNPGYVPWLGAVVMFVYE